MEEKGKVYVVPAQPGFELLLVSPERDEAWPYPVIAWLMEVFPSASGLGDPITVTTPVTPGDEQKATNRQLLKLPDGRVQIVGDRDFGSVEEALEYLKREGA